MPVACRNLRGSPAGERIHQYILDRSDVVREYTLSSIEPNQTQTVRSGFLVWYGHLDGAIRTHLNATCRWHVAATSSKTGGYNNFCPPGKNANRIHHPPPKIADLRQKIGDFYFFTITYSLFTKSSRRFLESNK